LENAAIEAKSSVIVSEGARGTGLEADVGLVEAVEVVRHLRTLGHTFERRIVCVEVFEGHVDGVVGAAGDALADVIVCIGQRLYRTGQYALQAAWISIVGRGTGSNALAG